MMTGTADVIILSSSPNPPLRSPAPDRHPETAQGQSARCASPLPLSSPADLPGLPDLPSRSRFFPTGCAAGERPNISRKTKSRSTKKVPPAANTEDAVEPPRPRRKTKKVADELELTQLGNPGLAPVALKGDSVEKTAEPQKVRSRTKGKNKGLANMTLAGKVTKAGTDSKSGKRVTTARRSPVESFDKPVPEKSNTLTECEELHLEEAMRRRLDWTPPRETAPSNAVVVDDVDNQEDGCDTVEMGGFGKLLSDYSFSGLSSASRACLQIDNGAGPTKRRRIELTNYSSSNEKAPGSNEDAAVQGDDSTSSGAKSKKKTKGQSKRFTTLTARMTAQYASKDPQDDDSTGDAGKENPKRRGQSRSKRNDPEFEVLSPEAAAKVFDEQDLVFGTCSQLEQEDSPQMLKEVQQAIQASENLALRERGNSIGQSAVQEPSFARSVARLAGSRNLWCVASRDTDGSLIQRNALDVVDLTNPCAALRKDQCKSREPASKREQEDWVELDDGKSLPPQPEGQPLPEESSASTTRSRTPASGSEPAKAANTAQPTKRSDNQVDSQPPSMPQYNGFTDAELSKQVAAYGFKSVRGRKKMIDLLQKCWESKCGSAGKSVATEYQAVAQPEHQSASTSAQPQNDQTKTEDRAKSTAKSKARGKSKPNKSTSLSSKLQDSHTTSLSATGQNKPGPKAKSMQSPQKSARANPTSTRPTTFIDVDEIQDSEEETIFSPSQVQNQYTDVFSNASGRRELCLDTNTRAPSPSPTKRQPASSSNSKSSPALPSRQVTKVVQADSSKRSSLPDLLVQIAKAVRAQPRSSSSSPIPYNNRGRSHPTWYEKILMYDPIILEDLTAWLNVEGLGLVGEDREVGAAQVREWCERKGICCCWKKNASW